MKRSDIWLILVLGIVLGLAVGIYAGRSFSSEPASDETARKSGSSSRLEPAVESENGPVDERSWGAWVRQATANFEKAQPNQPTPGIVEAMGHALRQEAGLPKMLLLFEMMRKEDFPVALEILRKGKTHLNRVDAGPQLWGTFWQRFGERDPEMALAKMLESTDLKYVGRENQEMNTFRGIARNNPQDAAEKFLQHPELPSRERAAGGLMIEWVRKDSGAASDWAQKNLEGKMLNSAAYYATLALDLLDIAKANAFVKTLPDGEARAGALRSIRSQIPNKVDVTAQQILDFVAINRGFGIRDRKYEAQMAAKCAETDAMAAANFFSQPSADGANDFAELQVVTKKWILKDSKAAENWAKGQERMPHYEAVATEFARAAEEKGDQAGAQRWHEAIAAHRKK